MSEKKKWYSSIPFLGEKRTTSNSLNDPIWQNMFGETGSGYNVTPESALNVSAVFACVRVLAESIASLPIKVYKRTGDGGKEEAPNHPLYTLLHDMPNEINTSYEFFETLMAHLNMRGNFYGLKVYNVGGDLVEIIPLSPAKMVPKNKNGKIVYEYKEDAGKTITYRSDEIWHVRGLSTDGVMGLSPITVARQAIGLAMATEAHGQKVFKNNARPGGILTYPGKLSEPAKDRLVKSWQNAYTGDNALKVAVIEEGLAYTSVGFSNDDAQFLETRTFQVEDIARIFRVPSVMIGRPDKTSTYASAEQFFLSFVVHTVRPWAVRLEQSANKNLLSERDRKKYFVEFNLDGLVRGDIKSRYDAYASAIQNKWMSANEARKRENLNPIEGGDVYENPNIQVNTAPESVDPVVDQVDNDGA